MRRVAVVTGGTAGIGRATARAFARAGWAVGVIARDPARLRSTEAELRTLAVPALGIAADVADAGAVEAAAARFERELGPIEAWVNNAMATVIAPAHEVTPEEYRRVTEVAYLGQVHGTLAALRRMAPRNRGRIIQISSGIGVRSAPLQSAYCGAKAAVRGFTDSLRAELLHDGVKVDLTVVYLPAVNTPQFDWARNRTGRIQKAPDPVFDPRLCADAVLFAAENPRREVWVGRSTAEMVLGQAVAPGLLDRYAGRMWEAQLGDRPPPHPEGNLFAPVPGDPGVDGRFGQRVKPTRTEYWTSRHRDAAVAGAAALGLLGLAALAAPVRLLAGLAAPRRATARRPRLPAWR
ncbi:SDR family oxidoreductase [Roseomonas sp. NAR14]|uniref:SDR family oxidoreductase n=1 Tax=Roseomonas acroporae TaxID=2937791 RepID=A0A9X1YDV2_9PROT|nr:SDR family oxidoreductase [Roseomonas acroporae]MCK8787972.1 SDR family oxidoreductase [Roseomonas acroporae]